MEPVRVAIEDTPEKFRPAADEIVPPLLELLRARSALEAEIFARSRELEAKKLAAGIPQSQEAPGSEALWAEYERRYLELVQPRCVPGF